MKCKDCPLSREVYSRGEDWEEWDIECAADKLFGEAKKTIEDDCGCTRTNKWILAQDPQELINRYWEKDAESWDKYMNEVIDCPSCGAKVKRKEQLGDRCEQCPWFKNKCDHCRQRDYTMHIKSLPDNPICFPEKDKEAKVCDECYNWLVKAGYKIEKVIKEDKGKSDERNND